MIEFNGVVKTYRRRGVQTRALDGLSMRIEKGEFVAIVGRSGSGKSTLLHLAAALDLPTLGTVVIDGAATGEMSDVQRTALRRHRVGLVFQFFNLLPTLPLDRNIALPLLLDGARLAAVRPRVGALLERIGLSARAGALPDELSGGEMQRVAIARALVTEPAILLADEPTGNLDSATSAQIMALIRESAHENGRTTLLVTHDAAVAAQADRIIHLADGRVLMPTASQAAAPPPAAMQAAPQDIVQ